MAEGFVIREEQDDLCCRKTGLEVVRRKDPSGTTGQGQPSGTVAALALN